MRQVLLPHGNMQILYLRARLPNLILDFQLRHSPFQNFHLYLLIFLFDYQIFIIDLIVKRKKSSLKKYI